MKRFLIIIAFSAFSFLSSFTNAALKQEKNILYLYGWAGYINPEVIKEFEKEFGIKVTMDFVDNNMMTESRILSNAMDYDIVTISDSPYFSREQKLGLFQKLDKSKLPNLKNLSKDLLKILATHDKNNDHAIPLTWGTHGMGYNEVEIHKIMPDAPIDSLAVFFQEDLIKKFSKCGVYFDDEAAYIIPMALVYLGLDPNSTKKEDLEQVANLLNKIRPHVTNISSSQTIDNLSRGDACLTLGFSGDIAQSLILSENSNNQIKIAYSTPKEGAGISIDVLAIPTNAKHPENAHKFLDFLLRPEIAAKNSNFNGLPSGNLPAEERIDPFLKKMAHFNLKETLKNKYYIIHDLPFQIERIRNKAWNDFKTFNK